MNDKGKVFRDSADLINKGLALLQGGPLSFYLEEMAAAHEMLMTRFSPLKIGDRAVIIRDLAIDEGSSWWPSRHFLIVGATGVVRSADCGTRGFVFGVEFDKETWINREGVAQDTDRKHMYCMGEKYLAKLPAVD